MCPFFQLKPVRGKRPELWETSLFTLSLCCLLRVVHCGGAIFRGDLGHERLGFRRCRCFSVRVFLRPVLAVNILSFSIFLTKFFTFEKSTLSGKQRLRGQEEWVNRVYWWYGVYSVLKYIQSHNTLYRATIIMMSSISPPPLAKPMIKGWWIGTMNSALVKPYMAG